MEDPDLMDIDRRQCTAKSKQSGVRCKKAPIPGGAVCRMHGGGAPQVQQAAKERLAVLVDPAIDRLGELVRQKQFTSTAYAAVKDVLDRNGLKPSERIEHGGQTREGPARIDRDVTHADRSAGA